MTKWMKHPKLPEGQLIEVHDDTVATHHRSGWEITDPPPPPPPAGDLEAAAALAEAEDAERAQPPESAPEPSHEPDAEPDTDAAAVPRPDETPTAAHGKES